MKCFWMSSIDPFYGRLSSFITESLQFMKMLQFSSAVRRAQKMFPLI